MGDFFITPPRPVPVSIDGLSVTVEVKLDTGLHPVRYDWGDGTKGKWGKLKQSHTYASAGVYQVRVKQKCPFNFWRSNWSDALSVTVG